MPFHVMTPVGVCTALTPRPKSPTGGLHHTPPRGAKACMHCKLPTKFRSSLQHQLREVQNGSDRLTIQKKGTAAPTAMAKKIRQQLRLLNSKRKHGRSDCHGQKDKSAAPTAEVKKQNLAAPTAGVNGRHWRSESALESARALRSCCFAWQC